MVDLRRLATPRGTALAWTGATVFGDCTAFEELSVVDPSGQADPRPQRERCLVLRTGTAENRDRASGIGITLQGVEQQSSREATAQVEVTRQGDVQVVPLRMQRKGRGWAVLRTPETCAAVRCP